MSEDKQQKENQKILEALLAQPHNKYCADCGASRPTWASAKIGVFICMKCAGIHRGLGTHISFVRSVALDKWKPHEIETIQAVGNLKAAQLYEGNLPPNYPRPSSVDLVALEKFIRAKYQHKKFYSEIPNVNFRRPSTERRPNFDIEPKDGAVSPRKVIRKTPPNHQLSPTSVKAPDHLSNISYQTPTLTSPNPPQLNPQPSSNTINLFGSLTVSNAPIPGSLFDTLEISKPTQNNVFEQANDNKACSTATKNEILGLFDQFPIVPSQQQQQQQPQQNLGLLFQSMTIGVQVPQYTPQMQLQQQLQQQQLYQQQLYQQQLYQQQLQQQHDFALLNKIQSKSEAQTMGQIY